MCLICSWVEFVRIQSRASMNGRISRTRAPSTQWRLVYVLFKRQTRAHFIRCVEVHSMILFNGSHVSGAVDCGDKLCIIFFIQAIYAYGIPFSTVIFSYRWEENEQIQSNRENFNQFQPPAPANDQTECHHITMFVCAPVNQNACEGNSSLRIVFGRTHICPYQPQHPFAVQHFSPSFIYCSSVWRWCQYPRLCVCSVCVCVCALYVHMKTSRSLLKYEYYWFFFGSSSAHRLSVHIPIIIYFV